MFCERLEPFAASGCCARATTGSCSTDDADLHHQGFRAGGASGQPQRSMLQHSHPSPATVVCWPFCAALSTHNGAQLSRWIDFSGPVCPSYAFCSPLETCGSACSGSSSTEQSGEPGVLPKDAGHLRVAQFSASVSASLAPDAQHREQHGTQASACLGRGTAKT